MLSTLRRYSWPILGILGAITAVSIYGLLEANPLVALHATMTMGAVIILIWLHHRIGFSLATSWGMVVVGFAYLLSAVVPAGSGYLLNAEIVSGVRVEHLLHALGTGVAALAAWDTVNTIFPSARWTFGVAFVALLMAMGVAAGVEMAEYVLNLFDPSLQFGGYEVTGSDLLADAAGAVLALLLMDIHQKSKQELGTVA